MKTKTLTVEVKAVGDGDEEGTFEAYAAVFNNIDSYGDKILPGAFAESLAEYGPNGEGVPLYWCHRMDDPFMNLGATLTAVEDDHGLLVKPLLDLEQDTAKHVHKLLKEKRVRMMSFAYDVLEGAWVKTEDDHYFYELRKLRLHEISIVPIGANQETEILAVKAATDVLVDGIKAGRTLSSKNEDELREAQAAIGRVLDSTSSDDEKSSSAPGPIVDPERPGAKAADAEQVSGPSESTANQLTLMSLSGQEGAL